MSRTGRPRRINPETLTKLEYAYSLGCSDREAALYAEIGYSTLTTYLSNNPDFRERRESLKDSMIIKALEANKKLLEDGDPIQTRWYLERRKREEFTLSQDINITASGNLSIDDKQTALHDYLVSLTASETPTDCLDGEK